MTHPFPAYLEVSDFHSTSVTDNALVANGLEFTAVTFPFFCGTEDSLTEQTVFFRTKGSVVDGLGFLDLAIRPRPDLLRGGQLDHKAVEILYFFHPFLLEPAALAVEQFLVALGKG